MTETLTIAERAHMRGIKSYDTALPEEFRARVAKATGVNPIGEIVWSYDDDILGQPAAVTNHGDTILRLLDQVEGLVVSWHPEGRCTCPCGCERSLFLHGAAVHTDTCLPCYGGEHEYRGHASKRDYDLSRNARILVWVLVLIAGGLVLSFVLGLLSLRAQ